MSTNSQFPSSSQPGYNPQSSYKPEQSNTQGKDQFGKSTTKPQKGQHKHGAKGKKKAA